MRLLPQLQSRRAARRGDRRRRRGRPRLEELELRNLLNGSGFYETLDQALILNVLQSGTPVVQTGNIGNGPDGAADVNFYQFTLTNAAQVQLTAQAAGLTPAGPGAGGSAYVLSLYDTDPLDPVGNRLLAQDDGATHAGPAAIDTTLAAGVYYVAVSGSGNRYFNPYLEGSGYNGQTGDYQLTLAGTDLGLAASDGPVVLRTEPADGAALTSSPLVLRAMLSGPVDPNSLQPDVTVQLYYDQTDPFTSSAGAQFSVGFVNFDPVTQELIITPSAPLAPGYYRLVLAGDLSQNVQVIQTTDATPIPLGANVTNPNGQDFTATFQVTGVEGDASASPGPDDTFATARQLGDVTNSGLVHVTGAIGDDATDLSVPFNPADVDIYHFQVSGSGSYAFGAEVFANRIGSTLDASMQLYRLDANGNPQLIASNDDSGNNTPAINGTVPLFSDPVVYASLSPGDYYLVVTSQFNTYDPLTSHSGSGGFSTGPYVLNLRLDHTSSPPHVVSTQIAEGATLTQPPTTFTVTFDEPMNLQPLAFASYLQTASGQIAAVFIQDAGGTKYYPRLTSFDPTTNQATFLMLDALPNGSYTWHLSGANGLANFAGNPLVGNDPSDPATGDYLVHFTVNAPPRGTPGNPTLWQAQEPNDSLSQPQQLGVLFPQELANTVTVDRPDAGAASLLDTADYYQITVLQEQDYLFVLNNVTGLASNVAPTVWAGGVLQGSIPKGSHGTFAHLLPGTYVIGVDWSSQPSAGVSYQLNLSLQGSLEPATSLTTGPAPALKLRLATDPPPPPPPSPSPPPASPPPLSSPPPPSSSGTPTNPGTINPVPPPAPPAPPAPVSSGPAAPPAADNLSNVGPLPEANAISEVATAVVTSSPVSAVTPAAVQAPAPAAPVSIPFNVVQALSDRALGAPADAAGGARAFLRETNNPPTQTVTAESYGPLLASSMAYLSAGVQPTEPDGRNLAILDGRLWGVAALPAALATRAAEVERELLASALATSREAPGYAEVLAKIFESWQLEAPPPPPAPVTLTPAPSVVSVPPPVVEAVADNSVDVKLPAAEVRTLPWYHLNNVGRLAVVALTMALVALRVQSWRAARAAGAAQGINPPPELRGAAPSDE